MINIYVYIYIYALIYMHLKNSIYTIKKQYSALLVNIKKQAGWRTQALASPRETTQKNSS